MAPRCSPHNLTIEDFSFLVWRTDTLFTDDDDAPALRWILDELGAPFGFSVQQALGTYDASSPFTLGLRHMRPAGFSMMPVEDHLAAVRALRLEYAAELRQWVWLMAAGYGVNFG